MRKILQSKKLYKGTLYLIILLLMFSCIAGLILVTHLSPQEQINTNTTYRTTSEAASLTWNITWGGVEYDGGGGVAVDASGNIYCTGTSQSLGDSTGDVVLIKYNSDGELTWNASWGGDSLFDTGKRSAIDKSGNIYCIGDTWSFGAGDCDLLLVKFAPNGTKLWNVTWGGLWGDSGEGVAVDISGNIYCTGNTLNYGAGGTDLTLIKFYPDGTKAWNVTWGDLFDDTGNDIIVDSSGNIYCTGDLDYMGIDHELVLVKFNSNGEEVWNSTWGGASTDYGKGVTIDPSGDIICVGTTRSFGHMFGDLVVIKFNSAGELIWNNTWGGAEADEGKDVAVDIEGNIYCIGDSFSFGETLGNFVLVKFYPNGIKDWNTTWGGLQEDYGYGVAMDASGNIICVSETYSFGDPKGDLAVVSFCCAAGVKEGIPGFEAVWLLFTITALMAIATWRMTCKKEWL